MTDTIPPGRLQTAFAAGDFLFREGEQGQCAYIIDSGKVEVTLEKDGRQLVMATLGVGDIVGELGIIDRRPHTTSARAVDSTRVTAVPYDFVSQKIGQADPTLRMFMRLAMARYRDLDTRIGQVFESLAPEQVNPVAEPSPTLEISNAVAQLSAMRQRIDRAVQQPVSGSESPLFGEATLQVTKVEVTDEILLRQALANRDFQLVYQPIVGLEHGRVVGCESLLRWKHPSGELLLPSRFLNHLETSGLITDLGYWIAEEACRFQRRLARNFPAELFVAINLSARQFDDAFLVPGLVGIMKRAGCNRDRIKFEVTENFLIDNPQLASRSLRQLKETGVKLAIDDFGTGYSSFSYLTQFPFDTLKIDRAFISSMTSNEKSMQIVRALINLSHDLGMEVVAEGIESAREAEIMHRYPAILGQGFYFSRPVEESEFCALLQAAPTAAGAAGAPGSAG